MANNLNREYVQKYRRVGSGPANDALNTHVLEEENYLYISHLDEGLQYWRLPSAPDEINDSMSSSFSTNTALGRSAPVMAYQNSGPRTVQISISLHRDIMEDINMNWSNVKLGYGEDYVDNLIKALQSICVPKYNLTNKYIEPPLVAVRLSNEVFIKGIVSGSIGITYKKPILSKGRNGRDGLYAQVNLSLTVTEVDPYDATTVYKNGSFRGMVDTFKSSANNSQADHVMRMGQW